MLIQIPKNYHLFVKYSLLLLVTKPSTSFSVNAVAAITFEDIHVHLVKCNLSVSKKVS